MIHNAFIKSIIFVFIAFPALFFPNNSRAYFMPVEQLVKMMAANFSGHNTLIITQSIRLADQDGQEDTASLEERVWLKAPCFFRSEIIRQIEGGIFSTYWMRTRQITTDRGFRRLLMPGHGNTIMTLLIQTGINIESVGFTRLNGVVAYRIGDKSPESPKLLIGKKTFLPLLFRYRMAVDQAKRMVTIRFHDYRKLGKGWYPFLISYTSGQDIGRRYSIIDLQINVPIEYPLLEIPVETALPYQSIEKEPAPPEDERLRDIIRMLKEKYR